MIKLEAVSKQYQIRDNIIPVLRDIHLQINTGEFVSIMGPSGSGKSTLMNLIGLLDRPTYGDYFFNNDNVGRFDQEQLAKLRSFTVGFIFQSFMLLPRMNLIENVSLPLLYQAVSKEQMVERSIEMLSLVGLQQYSERKPTELSGGQQQRVAIARALVTKPKVILADEPTGALDSHTGQEIFDLLKHFNKTLKTTVIIVTHDQNIAKQCDRIIKLQDGKIVA